MKTARGYLLSYGIKSLQRNEMVRQNVYLVFIYLYGCQVSNRDYIIEEEMDHL